MRRIHSTVALGRGGRRASVTGADNGAAAGLSTRRFDTVWYVERHPDSAERGRNPLVFFVETGSARGDAPVRAGPGG